MILRLGKISSLFALSLFCLGQSSLLKAQQDIPPEVLAYADKILYNGKVLSADDQFTIGEAVAIRGEKIMAVGQNDRILKMAGPNTEQVDLQGKTVVPGFVEVHTQFLVGGIGGPRVVPWSIYIDFTNFDAALREIREEVSRQGKPGRLMIFSPSILRKSATLTSSPGMLLIDVAVNTTSADTMLPFAAKTVIESNSHPQ